MRAIFEITAERLRALPRGELTAQLSRALAQRTELLSRERLPGVWAVTDKLQNAPRASERILKQRRRRTKFWSTVCLLLGILAFVPGMMEPREPSLILIGAASICLSLFHLLGGRRTKDPFQKPAQQYLTQWFALPENVTTRVSFSAGEMIVEVIDSGQTKKRVLMPFEDFECAVETDGFYLLSIAGKVTVLPKNCLVRGTEDQFRTLLASQTVFMQSNQTAYHS